MTVLQDLFYIVLFISLAGSVFTILSLLAKQVLRLAAPLWFGICGIAFFAVPIIVPTLTLISPEPSVWVAHYVTACAVWVGGMAALAVYYAIRSALSARAVRSYTRCTDTRILKLYTACAATVSLKQIPPLYFGTLAEPACVATFLRPVILLNKAIAAQLSDQELRIVLCHELTHIKRAHHLLKRAYDLVSIVHWFNPLLWIAKNEFAVQCEMDCDRASLCAMQGKTTGLAYASTMLHLMELSAATGKHSGRLNALGFILVKQRMSCIVNRPALWRLRFSAVLLASVIAFVLFFSAYASRVHFYPYPAQSAGVEWSNTAPASFAQ